MKKTVRIILIFVLVIMNLSTVHAQKGYEWAKDGIDYCRENGIMQGDEFGNLNLGNNLTRAEMAKMVSVACLKNNSQNDEMKYIDVTENMWSYSYIFNIQDFITEDSKFFRPNDYATREEFFSCVIYASEILTNVEENVLDEKFSDSDEVSEENKEALNAAVFHGYIIGDERGLRPKDNLTRAETCVFLERILNNREPVKVPVENEKEDEPIEDDLNKEEELSENLKCPIPTDSKYTYAQTPIKGESVKTEKEAVAWAKRNNAAQIFIDVAPLYWKYGEIFGVRADVLYAQAAKETGFGRYTGRVKPEMNNWAGIKKYGAVGDETDDHETFATPEDGVRGHFNHMSAYIGVDPVGETHGRYRSVKSLAWAGTVEYVEQLGGKWCPDVNYGYSILADYVDKM